MPEETLEAPAPPPDELDPHAPEGVEAPYWPDNPAEWITKGLLYRWADHVVFQVEQALVIFALIMMSMMVFLDAVHDHMMGDGKVFLDVIALVFAFGAGLTHEGLRERSIVIRFAAGAGIAAALIGLSQAVAHFDSNIVYMALYLMGIAAIIGFALKTPPKEDEKDFDKFILGVGSMAGLWPLIFFLEAVKELPGIVYGALFLLPIAVALGVAFKTRPARLPEKKSTNKSAEETLKDEKENTKRDRLQVLLGLLVASSSYGVLVASFPPFYSFALSYSTLFMFWIGFLGASMATYKNAHLKIDFMRKLVGRKSPRLLDFYNAASSGIALTFSAVLLYLSYIYVFDSAKGMYYISTPKGEIPEWFKTFAIVVSLGIMLVRFSASSIQDFIKGVKGTSTPAPKTSVEG